jgi:hypothetical protein
MRKGQSEIGKKPKNPLNSSKKNKNVRIGKLKGKIRKL